MTNNDAGQSPTATPVGGVDGSEMAAVQSAARWLVAAAAAVAAVLLTGVQFSTLGRLATDASPARLIVAIAASGVGLVAVGALLVLAARVLVHPGWTLTRLAQLETTDPKWDRHWMRQALSARRALLAPEPELDLAGLYRQNRALLVAWSQLHENGQTTLPDSLPDGTGNNRIYRLEHNEDIERLRARHEAATTTATRVSTLANLLAARRRYRWLVRALPILGVPLIAAVVTFTAATDAAPPVTTPLLVRIAFTPDPTILLKSGLSASCTGQSIEATAVAGTLEEPVVVATNPSCVLDRKQITAELGIAVPTPTK